MSLCHKQRGPRPNTWKKKPRQKHCENHQQHHRFTYNVYTQHTPLTSTTFVEPPHCTTEKQLHIPHTHSLLFMSVLNTIVLCCSIDNILIFKKILFVRIGAHINYGQRGLFLYFFFNHNHRIIMITIQIKQSLFLN